MVVNVSVLLHVQTDGIVALAPGLSPMIPSLLVSDRTRYRDYVVSVWVNMLGHPATGAPERSIWCAFPTLFTGAIS